MVRLASAGCILYPNVDLAGRASGNVPEVRDWQRMIPKKWEPVFLGVIMRALKT
jgi:hypothetical protein